MTEWDLAYMRRKVQPTDDDSLVLRLIGRAKFLREGGCYKSAELMEQAAAALAAQQPLHEQLREMGEAHAAQPAPVPDNMAFESWMDSMGYEESDAMRRAWDAGVRSAAPVPVPLTAEQIRDVCVDVHLKRDFTTNLEKFVAIARAIEAAHGIAASPEVP
jgi:hypothetical protein